MEMIHLSKEQLRSFLVTYQGLNYPKPFKGLEGIKEFVKRVGCLQYDPLNVVGRNIDLILQSRIEGYQPWMLEKLLYQDRDLIDGWDKMMAIYSTEDWPYFQRIRDIRKTGIEELIEYRSSISVIDYVDKIIEYITENGPSLSNKINLGKAERGTWGHGRIAGAVMDYMFNVGSLGIRDRKNVQRVYDIIENLIPEELLKAEDPFESDRDFYKWYVKRRIGSIGIYWDRSGEGWLGYFISNKQLRLEILNELCQEGELLRVQVDFIKENFYIRKEDYPLLLTSLEKEVEKKISFLAPLDNILWDRKLLKTIFNFHYTWEVYVPAAKRKYGYYVLPLLYGDSIVARFEPENHKGNGPLIIKNWWWEEGFTITEEVKKEVIASLESFCTYLNASGVSEGSYDRIFSD
ncbi:winged helix-turn-helix domain-containing protein [Alloiococcus sp. CFN-8]|uniref:winged helix-turn-helix domain-containing protein n=1 Tax=Alloiococcus sp. CFN-8 TaxID=3416081 RepID=UPI003CED80B5